MAFADRGLLTADGPPSSPATCVLVADEALVGTDEPLVSVDAQMLVWSTRVPAASEAGFQ
jgi:hypothetical protein